jgi:hypothetical protein
MVDCMTALACIRYLDVWKSHVQFEVITIRCTKYVRSCTQEEATLGRETDHNNLRSRE